MSTTRITLENLQAATDTAHIEKALESVPGVSAVTIDTMAGTAVVEQDGADEDRLIHAIGQLGYTVSVR